MNNLEKQIYLDAIEQHGQARQLVKCCEEMAELTQAICKRFDHGPGANDFDTEAVVEELADVEIMLEQLRIILEIDPALEARWRERKIRRLAISLGG